MIGGATRRGDEREGRFWGLRWLLRVRRVRRGCTTPEFSGSETATHTHHAHCAHIAMGMEKHTSISTNALDHSEPTSKQTEGA